jgi:activator of HSP90 ATPase
MMSKKIRCSIVLPASAEDVYSAWLDSTKHSEFTGDKANINPKIGGKFTAWSGYIMGKTLELQPHQRIVQAWRTTEFPKDAPDSKLEVLLEAEGKGTRMTLIHTNIPDGQGDGYKQGWEEYYFEPMKKYFGVK